MRNEANIMTLEKRADLLIVPARVSELYDMLDIEREAGKKSIEAGEVFMKARRQLVQQWPECRA